MSENKMSEVSDSSGNRSAGTDTRLQYHHILERIRMKMLNKAAHP